VGNIGTVSNAAITMERLTGWLRRFHDLVIKNQAELTELDSAIGDADHGINMMRGMSAVMEKLDGMARPPNSTLPRSQRRCMLGWPGSSSGGRQIWVTRPWWMRSRRLWMRWTS
jgi:dihydroxyacetone kinase-like protein